MANPYTGNGEGASPNFINLKKFNNGEIETIWDNIDLCGYCLKQWKNKRTKIARKYPATQKQAFKLKNRWIYRCSKCGKVGHNRTSCPLLKEV